MKKKIDLLIAPRLLYSEERLKTELARKLDIKAGRINSFRIIRKSIDARKKDVKYNLGVECFIDEWPGEPEAIRFEIKNVKNQDEIYIIGSGPAGLFAALRFIELGYKPIILERGKEISERKKDIALLAREDLVNPESNYCFGEGGAGTFSDGKLYTRSKKKGSNRRVLELLKYHGAQDEILIDSHPHIGTNVLPGVIKNIRNTIIEAGGEIHFKHKLTDLFIESDRIIAFEINNNLRIPTKKLILATGHSAREIYELLHHKGVNIESKGFAMGVRIEHPQALIDSIQYHCDTRGPYLPAASYSFVQQVNKRGVYSFCMCPGGYIVPSATEPGQVVVNGMSPSGRNSEYANSGMVCEITPEDYQAFKKHGPLAGMYFQKELEEMAFRFGNESQNAPAQRMADFCRNTFSSTLPKSSYYCGTVSSALHNWLPQSIGSRLKEAFVEFGKRSKGYFTNEAVLLGVESRSSSPVRIPRKLNSNEHTEISGLYAAGEGSGYAGGIVSSAIDGIRCAEDIAGIH